jgi:xanthine dehydrogenase YagT iron-sulfur-binding subunit
MALVRNAETDARNIRVEAYDGKITLGGRPFMGGVPRGEPRGLGAGCARRRERTHCWRHHMTTLNTSATPQTLSSTSLTLRINGIERTLQIDPRVTLLDAIREYLGLTGTKKGCDRGECGACTVLADGRRINACLTFAAMHEGRDITTIEGPAPADELHPLQAAFIEYDGFQCGYCTPGQIMLAVALLDEGHTGSAEEIREWMSGNICRCGAYRNIVAAIRHVAERATP